VPSALVHDDTLCELPRIAVHGFPVEVHVEVFSKIDARIGLGCNAVVGMLQLCFVDIDWDVCALEMVETSGMVKMQMTHDDALDIFDIVSTFGDSFVELLIFRVVDSCEDIVCWSTYLLGIVYTTTSPVAQSVLIQPMYSHRTEV